MIQHPSEREQYDIQDLKPTMVVQRTNAVTGIHDIMI